MFFFAQSELVHPSLLERFLSLPKELLIPVFVLSIIGTVAVIITTVVSWATLRHHQLDNQLKLELLQRGVPPEKIAAVINTPAGSENTWCKPHMRPPVAA